MHGRQRLVDDPGLIVPATEEFLRFFSVNETLTRTVTRGGQTDWFRYGADGMRTRSWGADGARVYLPGYEHRTDTGETKVYVGDYAVISTIGALASRQPVLRFADSPARRPVRRRTG